MLVMIVWRHSCSFSVDSVETKGYFL